jgi:hypothetical protein
VSAFSVAGRRSRPLQADRRAEYQNCAAPATAGIPPGVRPAIRIEIARPRKSQRDAAARDDVGNPVPGRKHANRTFLQ